MKYIFIVLSVIELIYVFCRELDFLSVGAISHFIYNYYCALGTVYISSHEKSGAYYYYTDISNAVYIIVILQIIILLAAMVLYDSQKRRRVQKPAFIADHFSEKTRTMIFNMSCTIALAITVYNIIRIGPSNLNADKSYIWERVSGLYIVGIWLGFAAFAYGIKNKKYILALLGAVPILLHFFFGSRAYFAAACIVVVVYFGKRMKQSIGSHLKIYAGAGVMAIFVLAYKKVYALLRQGDFLGAINVLFLPETYAYVFRLGEPRIVLANLNYIVDNHIKLGIGDIWDRVISIVPFLNDIFAPNYQSMSSILRLSMNSSYGLASNIWGEFWAMGSYPLLFIMFIAWICFLMWGNALISRNDWTAYFSLPIVAYLSFYIHRLDFVKAIGNFKMCLMAALIFLAVSIFATHNTKIYLNQRVRLYRER